MKLSNSLEIYFTTTLPETRLHDISIETCAGSSNKSLANWFKQ